MNLPDIASVYRRQRIAGEHGEGTEEYVPLGEVRGRARQEKPQPSGVTDSQAWSFRIRASEPVIAKDRLIINGVVLLVVNNVQVLGQKRGYVTLECSEVQDWRRLR